MIRAVLIILVMCAPAAARPLDTIVTQEKSVATGAVVTNTYAGSAAFNAAMSGPGIWLQKVTIY